MEGIFIFKAQRQRNSLEYVPYYNADNQNKNYQAVNIEKIIKKLGSQKISDIVCQNNLSNDFVRNALGLTEADLYEHEEDTITLSKNDKGVDLLIIWTDTKQQEPNAKKRFQSIRGIAGIYVGHDKKGIKYSNVSILCNAIASKVKTRKENLKKKGKQILQLIELLSRENNCEYITLDALDNVITYYHLFGYKLVNHPFTAERTSTTDYVKRLGVVVEKIRKVQERKTTRSDRKKNRMKDLMALLKEKRTIKEKLKRYMTGLYDVKERANFKYDYTPDTYAETGMDFVDELEVHGYKMYKSLRNNTANAASSTRKKNKKGKKKTIKGGGKKKKTGKKKTRKGGSAMAVAATQAEARNKRAALRSIRAKLREEVEAAYRVLDERESEPSTSSTKLGDKNSTSNQIIDEYLKMLRQNAAETLLLFSKRPRYNEESEKQMKEEAENKLTINEITGWIVGMVDNELVYYNYTHNYMQNVAPTMSAADYTLDDAEDAAAADNAIKVDNFNEEEEESSGSKQDSNE